MKKEFKDPCKVMTDQIIKAMRGGKIPWVKPWYSYQNPVTNYKTKQSYNGINTIVLGMSEYECPFWVTYKQALDLGGHVKPEMVGTKIIYGSMITKKAKTKDEKDQFFPLYKNYTVFNLKQTTLDIPDLNKKVLDFNPIEKAEKIIANFSKCPQVSNDGDRAYYAPKRDHVTLPPKANFKTVEGYYATLFHELSHSTGHTSRLDRKSLGQGHGFGSHEYSKEELIAEMSAAYLCGYSGITSKIDNTAAYLQSWIKTFQDKPRMLIQAGTAAHKATNHILGIPDQDYKKA